MLRQINVSQASLKNINVQVHYHALVISSNLTCNTLQANNLIQNTHAKSTIMLDLQNSEYQLSPGESYRRTSVPRARHKAGDPAAPQTCSSARTSGSPSDHNLPLGKSEGNCRVYYAWWKILCRVTCALVRHQTNLHKLSTAHPVEADSVLALTLRVRPGARHS